MPRWRELKRFCDRDGWELYKDTDHYFYRKIDDDGNIRMTKVSKGSGEIHTRMWKEILSGSCTSYSAWGLYGICIFQWRKNCFIWCKTYIRKRCIREIKRYDNFPYTIANFRRANNAIHYIRCRTRRLG